MDVKKYVTEIEKNTSTQFDGKSVLCYHLYSLVYLKKKECKILVMFKGMETKTHNLLTSFCSTTAILSIGCISGCGFQFLVLNFINEKSPHFYHKHLGLFV